MMNFKVGDEVVYGLHGKCVIKSIETKELSTGSVSFYQIYAIKNPIIPRATTKADAAILVPVESAEQKGLRFPMTKELAAECLKMLADMDYHFELGGTWLTKQKMLEEAIRKEGAKGLTKVLGHLHIMMKRDAVPPSEVSKMFDSVHRIFARELSECMGLTSKDVEPIILRALKEKAAHEN